MRGEKSRVLNFIASCLLIFFVSAVFIGEAFAPVATAFADSAAGTAAPAVSQSSAGPAGPTSMGPFQFILGTVNFFLIAFLVYFMLVLRPLQIKQDKQTKFISSLKAGDKVITSGGIYAKVNSVSPAAVVLEIAAGTKITIQPEHVREVPVEPASAPAVKKAAA